ncbi:hypothetical protein SO802_032094 [Lithocarpus litseifolius]|uniref:Small ribosomal subunit protein eS4 C-terminal domain-containing protein n=1 Tax=Lithocarpus litseifolius TaxID=425828 RepID=A0AAW2BNC0_9ROSI
MRAMKNLDLSNLPPRGKIERAESPPPQSHPRLHLKIVDPEIKEAESLPSDLLPGPSERNSIKSVAVFLYQFPAVLLLSKSAMETMMTENGWLTWVRFSQVKIEAHVFKRQSVEEWKNVFEIDREKHKGTFEAVHIQDATGHEFATCLGNVFTIGKGTTPWVFLPNGKGIKLTIIEEARKRLGAQTVSTA